jgi:hypothetical protein
MCQKAQRFFVSSATLEGNMTRRVVSLYLRIAVYPIFRDVLKVAYFIIEGATEFFQYNFSTSK